MKQTLKKLLALALVCLMLTALAIPAAADVIIEPQNIFYVTHKKECEYSQKRLQMFSICFHCLYFFVL